jgi:hypothetical protein
MCDKIASAAEVVVLIQNVDTRRTSLDWLALAPSWMLGSKAGRSPHDR